MPHQVPEQSGKLAVVTGANSGTGEAAATALAAAGARVVLAVRTPEKGRRVQAEIRAAHPSAEVEVRRLDLADQASVKEFAEDLAADGRPVDLLLNNAGVMMLPERHATVDGFEMQLGTNFFGPFALTVRLLPTLLEARAPRVVTMASSNQAPIDFADLNWERGYDPIRAYGRSKLADLLFSQQLARVADERGWNLLSLGAHPGNASTSIFDNGTQLGGRQPLALRIAARLTPRHSAQAGADPMLYAATAADVQQGGYYGPRFGLVGRPAPAKVSLRGRDEQAAARLWAEAERLTGLTTPAGVLSGSRTQHLGNTARGQGEALS